MAQQNQFPRASHPDDSGKPAAGSVAAVDAMVPVTAADAQREKLRRNLKILGGAALAILLALFIYKRSTDPINARTAFETGVRQFDTGRYQEAILSLGRAIDLKSDFAEAYRMRGRCYLITQDLDRALRDFTSAIKTRPSDADTLLDRADVYVQQKAFKAAEDDCAHAIQLNPKLDRAHNLRGMALRAEGDARAALPEFERAVELQPTVVNYYQRGLTYQVLGEHRLAVADFTEVIEVEPGNAHPYFSRAQSLRAMGDLAGARKDLDVGRALDGR